MAKYDVIYDFGEVETYSGNQKEIVKLAKDRGHVKHARTIAVYYANSNKLVGRWERNKSRWYEVL